MANYTSSLKNIHILQKIISVTLVSSVISLGAFTSSRAVEITPSRIKACTGDYKRLCGNLKSVPDIRDCFIRNWDKVSQKCKAAE
jgi:hypothetical protein